MAFRKPCDGCQIQNLECDCDDDIGPPKRQWPPEQCQPCVCHLVPPFNAKKPKQYNIPKPIKNLKNQLEPETGKFTGEMSLISMYMESYTPKTVKIPKSFKQREYFKPSRQPVSGHTSTGVAYQYKNGEPARLIRYCEQNILGKPKPICFTTTYNQDFVEKPDSRRKNFTKRFIFIPSPVPMNNKSLVQDSYVTHATKKVNLVKKISKLIEVDYTKPVETSTYKNDFVKNKMEKRKRLPWKVYEKSRKKVSEAKMPHSSEYKDNFVPITDPPTKLPLPIGDPCHGNCECYRPGICLPNNLNFNGRAKLCGCHESIDYNK